jgi:hypothetical protein
MRLTSTKSPAAAGGTLVLSAIAKKRLVNN